jgi:HSP20 family molecular chaperone IbpA
MSTDKYGTLANTSGYVQVLNNIPFENTWTFYQVTGGPNYSVVSSIGPWNSMQPDLDVSHYNTKSVVEIDLPGVAKDSIKILYDNEKQTLLYAGTYTRVADKGTGAATYGNRPSGKFNQSAYVGKRVDLEKATATFEDGVLTVVLPVLAANVPGSILIK